MEIKHFFFFFNVCIEHVKAINNTKSYIYIVFTAKTELTKYSFTQKLDSVHKIKVNVFTASKGDILSDWLTRKQKLQMR